MTDRTTAIGVEIDANPRTSAVAWGAVLAGALVAAAVTLALFVLGTGIGLTLVSPWASASAGIATITLSTVIWLVVTQWISAGVGGYLTGRLRTRWTSTHSDEVFFRDTAHGFLTWATATILVAALTASFLSSVFGAGAQVAGQVTGGAAQGAAEAAKSVADPTAYFVDSLYRPAQGDAASPAETGEPAPSPPTPSPSPAPAAPAPGPGGSMTAPSAVPMPPASTDMAAATPGSDPAATREALRAETARIMLRGMTADAFPEDDRTYLVEVVARQTGMTTEEAQARVDGVLQNLADVTAEAQQAAETAREVAATLAVIAFVSLLVGAFIACVAAALGGSHRDEQDALVVVR